MFIQILFLENWVQIKKNVATGYRLFKDNSTVYSGAGRKFHFNAAPGYKFVLSYKNVNGKVWIIRNNTTKLAQSLISYYFLIFK